MCTNLSVFHFIQYCVFPKDNILALFPDALSCPRGYLYNPHSMSCFNISTQKKNWDDAKATCQSAGDRLAVFDSLETISWAKHMRKTHQGDVKHAKHEGLDFILFCWIIRV